MNDPARRDENFASLRAEGSPLRVRRQALGKADLRAFFTTGDLHPDGPVGSRWSKAVSAVTEGG